MVVHTISSSGRARLRARLRLRLELRLRFAPCIGSSQANLQVGLGVQSALGCRPCALLT